MSTTAPPQLTQFALDVAEGLGAPGQKYINPRYFYDDLGSVLFEAITLLPEYGLTRADERLLKNHASDIAAAVGSISSIAELGSGSGKKTRSILESFLQCQGKLTYYPIDVSAGALQSCERELSDVAEVQTVCRDWIDGLVSISSSRKRTEPMLLLFLGSSLGNLARTEIAPFLRQIRSSLLPGDFFVLGADLVKDVDLMLAAYDDPTGVTAAFNLNVLGRLNRELDADFDLRSFAHEVRWDEAERRIEMHLLSGPRQTVQIAALGTSFEFAAGETIWTESSHKFTPGELNQYADASGFLPVALWTDNEWPFAEVLWRAV